MTDRKPPDVTFRSWIDQQISDAAERGAFDNLSGAGKPLPDRGPDADQAWLMDWLRREGVRTEEMLPTPLRLRKESHRLTESVQKLRTEAEVLAAVAELNQRIMDWRRLPIGPPIFVPLVDADAMLGRWRAAHPQRPPASPAAPSLAARSSRRWRLPRRRGRT